MTTLQHALQEKVLGNQRPTPTSPSTKPQKKKGVEVTPEFTDLMHEKHATVSHLLAFGKYKSIVKKAIKTGKTQIFPILNNGMQTAQLELPAEIVWSDKKAFANYKVGGRYFSILLIGLDQNVKSGQKVAGKLHLSLKIAADASVVSSAWFCINNSAKPAARIKILPLEKGEKLNQSCTDCPMVAGSVRVVLQYKH